MRVWIIRQNSDAAFVRKYYVFAHKFPRNSIFYAQRVEQVKHCLCHHRRAAEVVLDVLWSVVLLEIGVAQDWSNEACGIFNTQSVCLRIWTVQCQVEMEVRILLLQCQEVLHEEYLINSTSTIEIVHLTVLGRKGLKHVHNKSTCELLYAIAEGLTTLFLCAVLCMKL